MGAIKTDDGAGLPAKAGRFFPAGRGALGPALFLCLSVALGGVRSPAAWAVFSAALFIYLAFFEMDFSFSGSGLCGLLAVWLAAGLAFSPEPLNSFRFFSRYLVLLAFFNFARKAGEAARTLWIGFVFLLAGAACLTVFWQALTGQGVGRTFAVSGMMGMNINYSAAFMASAFAGFAALFFRAETARARLACLAALALLGGVVAAVNSRGAVLGATAAVFFIFFQKGSFRAAAYFAIAALLLIVMIPAEQFNWLMKLSDPRSLGRFGIWGSAFDAMSARPVFGWGLGLFERAFEIFKFPFYNGVSYYGHSTLHAHSEPLNLAAEAGIPAAVIFIWAWARGVVSGEEKDLKTVILKVFSVSLFVQASVDVLFYSGALQALFFGTMGMLAQKNLRRAAVAAAPGARVRALSLLLACCSAAALLNFSFERSRTCALDPAYPPSVRESCLKKAARFSPGDSALLEAAVPLSLAVNGNFALAAARLEEGILKNPKDPFKYCEAAGLYRAGGDPASAKVLLAQALSLEPDLLRARFVLAEIAAAGGDARSASLELEKIRRVLARNPDVSRASAYDRELLTLPAYAKITRDLQRKK